MNLDNEIKNETSQFHWTFAPKNSQSTTSTMGCVQSKPKDQKEPQTDIKGDLEVESLPKANAYQPDNKAAYNGGATAVKYTPSDGVNIKNMTNLYVACHDYVSTFSSLSFLKVEYCLHG